VQSQYAAVETDNWQQDRDKRLYKMLDIGSAVQIILYEPNKTPM